MLSGLIMNVFTPALLLSKLGSSVDAQQAFKLWPIAANMIACHAVGLGLGLVQGKLLSMPQQMKPQLVVMNSVGNIGNLPLVLVRESHDTAVFMYRPSSKALHDILPLC